MYLDIVPKCKYSEGIFETQFLKPIGQVKKHIFPNWLMPTSSVWSKILFHYKHFVNCFLYHLCTHEVHDVLAHIETHTYLTSHMACIFPYISAHGSFHLLQLWHKCPCSGSIKYSCTPVHIQGSVPAVTANPLTVRNQVAAPSPTSLGPIPQDRKQHLSPVPNKHYKQQPPSQPTNLTSSTTSWIHNIFPSGDF